MKVMSEHKKSGHRMEHGAGEKRDVGPVTGEEKLYARRDPEGNVADEDRTDQEWSPSQDRKEHPDPETSPDDDDHARDERKNLAVDGD